MLHDVLKKANGSQTTVLLTAVFSVFQINPLAFVCFLTLNPTVVERRASSLDFVLDGVVRSSQMLDNAVDRPSILATNFNFVSFFAQNLPIFKKAIDKMQKMWYYNR